MLTQSSQTLADLRDAQLFITYVRLMQALDAKGQAELLREQQVWLRTRAERAQAAVTSQGGTLAPLEYSGEFARITEERRNEILRRLQELSTQRK